MKIRIDSNVLNRFGDIHYGDIIPVFLDNNPNHILGSCQIILDKNSGHIYADLSLKEPVDFDLFVYFFSSVDGNGYFEIENVGLHSKQRNDASTKRLKEMIVNYLDDASN